VCLGEEKQRELAQWIDRRKGRVFITETTREEFQINNNLPIPDSVRQLESGILPITKTNAAADIVKLFNDPGLTANKNVRFTNYVFSCLFLVSQRYLHRFGSWLCCFAMWCRCLGRWGMLSHEQSEIA
jgi:hypothetical protein